VLKIQALILEPHKQNLCETNSIQKTTKFIINIMSKNHEKKSSTISIQQLQNNNKVDDYEEYETRTKIEKEVIVTSSTVFNIIAWKIPDLV